MKTITLIFAAIIAFAMNVLPLKAQAAEKCKSGKAQSEFSVLIDAPARAVWNAIYIERQRDPDIAYSKVLEESGNVKVIEQKFINIPLLGSVVAISRQVEDRDHRIDYTLVSSNRFKALDGSWQLLPVDDGRKTRLSLQSNLDIGIPFSSAFIKATTQKKMEVRLAHIKNIAETESHVTAYSGTRSSQ